MRVFISHSHDDASWAERLRVSLGAASEGALDVWSDARLGSGDNWRVKREREIRAADLITVLLSPAYVSSSFVSLVELPLIVSRAREGTASIVPIVVHPVQLAKDSPLWHWQFVNLPDRPLSSLKEHDLNQLFEHVARAMRDYARDRAGVPASGPAGRSLLEQIAGRMTTIMARRSDPQLGERRREATSSSRLVFAIMPYTDDMEPIFEGVRAAAVGLEAKRVKDVVGDYWITDKILELIIASRFVVADLTVVAEHCGVQRCFVPEHPLNTERLRWAFDSRSASSL